MKSIFASFNLTHGSLYGKPSLSNCQRRSSATSAVSHDVLLNDDNGNNILTSNFEGLMEQLENRCEKVDPSMLDRKVPAYRKEQLKRQLKSNVNVSWHLYDEADLWTALKNYLRHLPSCPLGSTHYLEWSRVQWDYWDQDKISRIRSLLHRLTASEYKLVNYLFRIFYKITHCTTTTTTTTTGSDDTVTSPAFESEFDSLDIAARLGPYLIWEQGQAPRRSTNEKVDFQTVWLVSYMIENYVDIFK